MRPPELISELQRAMVGGDEHLFDQLPLMIRQCIKERVWEVAKDRKGEPFRSFEAFVVHPLWQGLESSVDDLLAFCRKSPDAQQAIREAVGAAARHGEIGGGRRRDDNIISAQQGTSATYALRRLKRDRPDLADQVVRGELSAHAAAIAAGFRNKPVQIAKDPEKAAAAIITARGLTYAKDLAAAIMAWESA